MVVCCVLCVGGGEEEGKKGGRGAYLGRTKGGMEGKRRERGRVSIYDRYLLIVLTRHTLQLNTYLLSYLQ